MQSDLGIIAICMLEAMLYYCYEYADHLKPHLEGSASTGIYPFKIIIC